MAENLTVADWAWLAGFFDGEGCVTLGKRGADGRLINKTYQLRLYLTNTNRECLELVRAKFGGDVRVKSKATVNWRTSYSWLAVGPKAGYILRGMLPYLVIKRLQADIGLRYISTGDVPRGQGIRLPVDTVSLRHQLKQELSFLNRRGPRQENEVCVCTKRESGQLPLSITLDN